MLLMIDMGFFSFLFYKDERLDEDAILCSSEKKDRDGDPSSNKCEVKNYKNPEKVAGVDKNRLATG